MAKKALLMILDGWGEGPKGHSNAIYSTPTPYLDFLRAAYPHSTLKACGEDVGLPDGQMGNSEVGHLNIGGGRVVYQDLVKINKSIEDGSIMKNPEIVNAYTYAKENGKAMHIMGLTSTGGVHSSLGHLMALCDIAKEYGLERVFVHCFMDGRDTDPESGKGFVAQVVEHCQQSAGTVATKQSDDMVRAIQESYDEGVTDEFIKPIVNSTVDGRIQEGDVVIFFNFRNDRAKQITIALTQKDKPEDGMSVIKGLQYYCMTPYDPTFNDMHILFPKENVDNTLSEYLSSQGKRQLHIAETEKYAHVTFFFSGGREQPFENEDRILVPSPDVATYDLKPEMSAYEVRDKLVAAIREDKYDFIVVNYANGDMVGHTGVYDAICKAVKAVDRCVHDTVEAARATGYEVIIIADHGNADHAINTDGTANTAHSLNPVPIIYVTEDPELIINTGRLADVAPSILQIMGLPQPKEMTGHGLIDVTK